MPERIPRARSPHTFGRRLAFAFATVAAVTAILAAALLSVAWSYQFNEYVREGLQAHANQVATIVATYYPVYGYDFRTLSQIPMLGASSNIGVQVLDEKNQIVYDEASMRRHMEGLATGQVPSGQTTASATKPNVVLQPDGPA